MSKKSKCKFCNNYFSSKSIGAHTINCIQNPKKYEIRKNSIAAIRSKIKIFIKKCSKCNKEFSVNRRINTDGEIIASKREKKYCCLRCANSNTINIAREKKSKIKQKKIFIGDTEISPNSLKKIKIKYTNFSRDRKNKLKTLKPLFTFEEFLEKIKNSKCYLSGEYIDLNKVDTYQMDHIIPVSNGGSNSLDNLGLTTKHVNLIKSNLSIEELLYNCKNILINNGYEVNKRT